jgi:hypothetical protein
MGRRGNFDPKKKAKQFSEGTFTASQTGARQEAERYANEQAGIQNAQDVADAVGDTQSFEDFISGKRKKRGKIAAMRAGY